MPPSTQEEAVVAPANITADELAVRRASRRQASSAPAPTGEEQEQPTPEADAPTAEEQTPDPVPDTGDTTQEQETTEEPQQETEAAPQAGSLDALITSAIAAASTATDRQSAIKEMARRIGAVAAERDAERATRQELEAKINASQGQGEAPIAPEPNDELAAMDQQLASIENALNVIEANPDGYTYKDKDGNEQTLDADQLRQLKHRYARESASLAARRDVKAAKLDEERQRSKIEADELAVVQYPWLTNPKAPETQLAIRELAAFPKTMRESLRSRPDFNVIMGRYVTGLLAEQARAKGKAPANPIAPGKKPASNGQIVPRVVTSPAGKAQTSAAQKSLQEANERFKKTGSHKDMAEVRKLKRQLGAA